MKFLSKIVKGMLPVLAVVLLAAVFIGRASAIPYSGDSTPSAPSPAFNVYTGTPDFGDEHDFFRGKVAGSTGDSTNVVNAACETGTRFTLWIYVHNGASQYQNGDGNGPSVAKDTKVKVDLKNANAASSFNPDATISARNAASVTDGMKINCTNGKTVTLSYKNGTAVQHMWNGGKAPVSDSIVTTGAPVGTNSPDGNMWGCWEQRIVVTLDVEVTEKPQPKPSKGECKVTDVKPLGGRKISAKVTEKNVENAQVVGYKIDWGDGSSSNKQEDTHEYAKDGKYIITGYVQIKFANGDVKYVTAADCAKEVTFKPDTPVTPVTPPTGGPTTMPVTGPGDVAAIFAAVSVAAGVAYRFYIARRFNA